MPRLREGPRPTTRNHNKVNFWSRIFGLDLRALGAARIVTGLVLLGDQFVRATHLSAFYTSEGAVPRQVFLASYHEFTFPSLHLANDTWLYQAALWLIQTLLAGALLAGWHTRWTTAASWLLLMSVHERNPLILNSGDSLLAALLFWAIWLPWGERYSWDARGQASPDTVVLSAASVGWCLQMTCLYLFAALHKIHPVWLTEKTAVVYALSIDCHASRWADTLLAYPDVLRWLSPWVVRGEALLALAILLPWPAARRAALLLAALMHWSFGLFLEIGIFRFTPWIGLIAMTPWPSRGHRSEPLALRDHLVRPLSAPLLGLCLLTWAINFEGLGKGERVLLEPGILRASRWLTNTQHWGVFAGPGLENGGWFAIKVTTSQGETFDAWQSDRPFQERKPVLVSATFPDDRWRKWMMNLPGAPENSPFRERFAAWCLEQWNRRHPESPAQRVEVYQVLEVTSPDGTAQPPRWILLAEASP